MFQLEVTFDDPGLGELCKSEKELRRKWGVIRAKKIQARLAQLRAAETLEDMRSLPGHCHELRENFAGQLAVDLDQPWRLLFRPRDETEPGPGGGLDWNRVVAVVITSVVDYH
jgi:plasmid maintenance system killer protein